MNVQVQKTYASPQERDLQERFRSAFKPKPPEPPKEAPLCVAQDEELRREILADKL